MTVAAAAMRLPLHAVCTLEEARRLPVFSERARPLEEAEEAARAICHEVRAGGETALRELTRRFDGVDLESFRVGEEEVAGASRRVPEPIQRALELAAQRIRRFHEATAPPRRIEAPDRLAMRREFRPVAAAGLYVPGGAAAYPSSVLMLALPARIAGVRRAVLVSPPGPDGELPPAVLFAARIAGVDEIYRLGGAQAIAALAYGAETIQPVDVIVGPGNRFVTAAKRLVYGRVAVEGLAGPSEIALISDGSTPARWAALDVLAQLEHDADARALVLATDGAWLEEVSAEICRAAAVSPRRAVLDAAIGASAGLITPDLETAMAIAGAYAPEHLSILTADPEALAGEACPAGAVFLGPFAPVAIGDYLAGPNHTLPTGGTARSFSGVGVESFGRWVSIVGGDRAALAPLIAPAALLAEAEGLPGHAASLRAREDVAGAPCESGASSAPEPRPPAYGLSRRARTFQPYRAARHEALSGILLDANENPEGGFGEVPQLAGALARLGRYPDPANTRLRAAAAGALGVPAEALFAGNGSDEAIDLLFRAFTDPGDEVLVAAPTYGMYAVQAALNEVSVREVLLDRDFRLDVAALLERAGPRTRLLFLCSPNNPTGNLLGRERILDAVCRFPGLVVVDEAYVEYAEVASLGSEAARTGSSLVVLRTLSKAWGLAGLRVGFAVGDRSVIAALQRIKLPYNLSGIATALAIEALGDGRRLERAVRRNAAERGRLQAELRGLRLEPLPSAANFLLVPHADAPVLVRRLAGEWGVIVRDRSGLPRIPAGFRVSVGTPEENDRFLEALSACLA